MRGARQRAIGDCGIVALSVALQLPYDVIADAVAEAEPRWRGLKGLHNHQVIAAASSFGVELRPMLRLEPTATGVLRVRWNQLPRHGGHFVALRRQRVFCPAQARDFALEEYATRYDARYCTLLALS